MTRRKRRLGLSSLVLLLVLTALGNPTRAQLALTEGKDGLDLRTSAQTILERIQVQFRVADKTLSGPAHLSESVKKTDSSGAYELRRYTIDIATSGPVHAILELRLYPANQLLLGTIEYDGPPLAAQDSIVMQLSPTNFARGMALHRLKRWWLAPTFVSDPRLVSGSNQLLLWQQLAGEAYHLLVPLAGGGMVAELKVLDFDKIVVSASSHDSSFAARRVPLFAYVTGTNPYALASTAFQTAFDANRYYGKLRWQKSYPQVFDFLGWCSWNTYYENVSEEKVLNSVRSLQANRVPVGFVLIDEGWRTANGQTLAAFEANLERFPHGIGGLARTLHDDYHIPYVGVWHTFQGYWHGVDPTSEIGKTHRLFAGNDGMYLPDPRGDAGESFYDDWYKFLNASRIDFVKVDNQASTSLFTDSRLPIFDATAGEQKNIQEAAHRYFSSGDSSTPQSVINLLNCMEMSLENAFNWRFSNLARNSEDYDPNSRGDIKDHVFWNAYNAYWTANFAYPDWDMFETSRDDAEYQGIARAISGGPIYTTDSPEKENPSRLLPLAFQDGRLLRLDGPGLVTRDMFLTDPSVAPIPLKVAGRVTRPGLSVMMVATFNVNKSAKTENGVLRLSDLRDFPGRDSREAAPPFAVYQRGKNRVVTINHAGEEVAFELGEYGSELFTLTPLRHGVAVFGLLNKYLAPAAVVSVEEAQDSLRIRIVEEGELGVFSVTSPQTVRIDGEPVLSSQFTYSGGLLRIPQATFHSHGQHDVEIHFSH